MSSEQSRLDSPFPKKYVDFRQIIPNTAAAMKFFWDLKNKKIEVKIIRQSKRTGSYTVELLEDGTLYKKGEQVCLNKWEVVKEETK